MDAKQFAENQAMLLAQTQALQENNRILKEELQKQREDLQKQREDSKIKDEALLKALEELRAVSNPQVDATKIRKNCFEKVLENFRKSSRVKEFNPLQYNAKDWIDSTNNEISMLCTHYGLDESTLLDKEKVQMVRFKLPHGVQSELLEYCKREPGEKTFETITYSRFSELLLKHCGASVPLVNVVMSYYGPDREIKPKDMSMLKHVLQFKQKLHSVMKPSTNDEKT